MKPSRKHLIDALSEDLTPVKPLNLRAVTIVWYVGAFAFAICMMLLVAPFRENIFTQLATSKQFIFESVLGLIAITILIYRGIALSRPSSETSNKALLLPIGILTLWLGMYVFGYFQPALEPALVGKRPHCSLEVILISIPSMLVGMMIIKKQWPIMPTISALLIGLAAGAIPQLLMQFGCMYETTHILIYHVLPGLGVGAIAAVLSNKLIQKV